MRNELEARFPVVAGLRLSAPALVVAVTLLALSTYFLLADFTGLFDKIKGMLGK